MTLDKWNSIDEDQRSTTRKIEEIFNSIESDQGNCSSMTIKKNSSLREKSSK